jgi:SAM-dependent methyltransferase
MSAVFEQHPELYDSLIDWPKRLSNEAHFFRTLFERVRARRILDVACGTGHHAAMFNRWGLEVLGVDASPQMVEFCRQRHGQSRLLRWTVGSFEQPLADPESFDAVVCVGNSLALAADQAAARDAVGRMLSALRGGGICIVQVVNLWSLPDGPCRWQKVKRVNWAGRDHLIIKGVHRSGSAGWVEFIAVALDEPQGASEFQAVRFLGLEAEALRTAAQRAGAGAVEFWGDYHFSPFDVHKSPDLVMVAYKQVA